MGINGESHHELDPSFPRLRTMTVDNCDGEADDSD